MIAGLPYDAELEYLETTGTQYVDKIYEFPGTENSIRYEFGAILTQQTSTNQSFFFVPPSGNGARAMFYQATRIFGSCDPGNGHSVSGVSIGTYFDAKVGFASDDSIIITVGSSTKHFSRTFYRCNHVLLFANNPRYSASAKLYYARVIVDSVLVRDLIPVRFTNELGQAEGAVYDRVSRKLFRNQGTEDPFVLGPDKAATSVPVMGLHFMRRPRYTAKDYVQGGLVAMWDGIENAGWGAHDSNATVWKDLLGGGDSELTAPRWNEDSFFLTRLNYPRGQVETSAVLSSAMASASILSNGYSFQIVTKNNGSTSSFHQIFGFRDSSTVFLLRQSDWIRRFYSAANGYVWGLGVGNYAGTITITKDVNDYRGFANSSTTSSVNLTPGTYTPDGDVSIHIGGLPDLGSNMRIDVCCVRLYSRALTANEIAHNYAVDKERFNLP